MYHITEVHVLFHFTFEGYFYRLRDRHRSLTGSQCQGNRSGICSESYPFRHPGMRVTTDNDGPFVNSDIIQYFMDHIRHRVILAFRVTGSDHTKVVHKLHQLRNISLCFFIPYRSGMTTGLVSAVHDRGDNGSRHRFQFLGRHQTGSILGTYDVYFYTYIRTGM